MTGDSTNSQPSSERTNLAPEDDLDLLRVLEMSKHEEEERERRLRLEEEELQKILQLSLQEK